MSDFEKGYLMGWRAALDEAVEVMLECFSDMAANPSESDDYRTQKIVTDFQQYIRNKKETR